MATPVDSNAPHPAGLEREVEATLRAAGRGRSAELVPVNVTGRSALFCSQLAQRAAERELRLELRAALDPAGDVAATVLAAAATLQEPAPAHRCSIGRLVLELELGGEMNAASIVAALDRGALELDRLLVQHGVELALQVRLRQVQAGEMVVVVE